MPNVDLNDTTNQYRAMAEVTEEVKKNLSMLAAAYLKATNISPEECELVIEHGYDKTVYYFQRRDRCENSTKTIPPTQPTSK